ncbi:hypothetical protein M440DRAFT_1240539 [Trichoderma longibrachiatum ATCC 18648]|uniref:Uncharacterized protein n=1 Tax=Trichoderma longibrachiatum ATCC 18648 TaxID=983965 RepID=A0A2T4C5Z3_TRILO|nr:hypothetical protein M440DRAFT_1240539 [Trichoderma longibrachiatum ATCC 18648]
MMGSSFLGLDFATRSSASSIHMGFADGERPSTAQVYGRKRTKIVSLLLCFLTAPSTTQKLAHATSARSTTFTKSQRLGMKSSPSPSWSVAGHVAEREANRGIGPAMGVPTRSRYWRTGHSRKRQRQAAMLQYRDFGRGELAWGKTEKKLHAELMRSIERNHSGYSILLLLTPRIHDTYQVLPATTNIGGALWCHRSHMCQNAVDASPGHGPWAQQGWNLRGQRKTLTPAAGIYQWRSVSRLSLP